MASAATLALIATAATAAGSIVSGIQGAKAGREQEKLFRQQAALEKVAATEEERQTRREGQRLRSAQLARFGKAGVTLTGTPAFVLAETAEEQERDVLLIRFGGESKAQRAIAEGKLARSRGQQALVGGIVGAGTTLLGSGAFTKKKGK